MNAGELIDFLAELKTKCLETGKHDLEKAVFEQEEIGFICNLILTKKKDLAFMTAVEYIADTRLFGIRSLNTASLRRIKFYKSFMLGKGNATRAAIDAGYSPRSAKQQGHRVLKWIQEHQTTPIGARTNK